jgi:hypothetical protein
MDVTIHSIERSADSPDLIELGVAIGDSPITRYRTSFNDPDSKITYCEIESDLFMSLSNIAHAKYAKSTVFQVELTGIVKAFSNNEFDLKLPITLGTTKYCVLKPSLFGIAYNKCRYYFGTLLWKIGFNRPNHGVGTKQGNAG